MPSPILARATSQPGAIQQFVPRQRGRLNPYAKDGIDRSPARILPHAIISLGAKVPTKDGRSEHPRPTQRADPQWLHLHEPYGPTPGIRARLEARAWRSLTVMLPDDERDVFLSQMWTRFKASSLEAWGDERGLHVIYKTDQRTGEPLPKPRHVYLDASSPDPRVRDEFKRQFASCTPETRLFFELAEWRVRDGKPYAVPVYPDGLGYYALRTGSPNAVKVIDGNLDTVQRATNGHLKGIPLELEVIFLPATRPDGVRTEIPSVRLVLKPPFEGGFSGEPVDWRLVLDGSVEQARMLEMPALPARPDVDDLILEGEVAPSATLPPDSRALQAAQSGDFACDYPGTLRAFMAATAGRTDDERHAWLAAWSEQALGPDRAFRSRRGIQTLSHVEAMTMLADLHEGLASLPDAARPQPPEVVEPGTDDAAAAAAAPAASLNEDEPDEDEDEEDDAELLALANAPEPPAPPPTFAGNQDELVRDPNTPEGRSFARVVQQARALNLDVRPFLVTYGSVTRGDLARRYDALQQLVTAHGGPTEPSEPAAAAAVVAPASAPASFDDLPF